MRGTAEQRVLKVPIFLITDTSSLLLSFRVLVRKMQVGLLHGDYQHCKQIIRTLLVSDYFPITAVSTASLNPILSHPNLRVLNSIPCHLLIFFFNVVEFLHVTYLLASITSSECRSRVRV
jgi:hypothetical protein